MIRVVGKSKLPEVVMSDEQPPPEEVAAAHRRRAIFERNRDWYQAHWSDIATRYAGLFVCVSGGEVFAGEDSKDVYARAAAAHPDERGAGFTIQFRSGPAEGTA